MTDDMTLPGVLEKLRLIVGPGHVSAERADCDLATADIFDWPDRKSAAAVVWPKDTPEVSGVLKVLHAANIATVPRGAGLSYTGGLAVERTAVVVDVSRLNDVTVNRDDCYATIGGEPHGNPSQSAPGHTICEVCRPVRSPERFPLLGAWPRRGFPRAPAAYWVSPLFFMTAPSFAPVQTSVHPAQVRT